MIIEIVERTDSWIGIVATLMGFCIAGVFVWSTNR